MDGKNSISNAAQTSSSLTASCHCTSVSLPIHLKGRTNQKSPLDIPLCHCSNCRRSTGLLCTSYAPIAAPPVSVLAKTTAYPARTSSHNGTQRYFCSNCGCHVFRSSFPAEDSGRGTAAEDGKIEAERMWEVATGVLSDVLGVVRISRHENVQETVDGGLSIFISEQNRHTLPDLFDRTRPEYQYSKPKESHEGIAAAELAQMTNSQYPQNMTGHDFLQAHCACHTVEFHISRPDAASLLPHSPFPDLMIPYYTHDPQIPNPHDEKWWLRSQTGANVRAPGAVEGEAEGEEAGTDIKSISSSNPSHPRGAKYLAGTCACRSCRLTSGFEIQTWAFIPRTNISFHLPPPPPPPPPQEEEISPSPPSPPPPRLPTKIITPLDFPTLHARRTPVLKTYESSPGVQREFCGTCGATVFWHDKWRPDIIDVSVGLLRAPGGAARAEIWLEWWAGRVSFAEEAGRGVERDGGGDGGREGGKMGWDLIPALERGLKRWEGERQGGERDESKGVGGRR